MSRPDLFQHVLNNLNGGAGIKLSERLNECVKATQDTGKATELTLTLKVKSDRSGSQYLIDHKITTKLPEPESPTTIMWATPEGNLLTENPHQRRLDLRSIGDEKPKDLATADDDKSSLRSL